MSVGDRMRDQFQRAFVHTLTSWERVSTGAAYNPLDRRVHADPYPTYKRLRERDPVHRSRLFGGWVLSRYDDVQDVLKNARFSADERKGANWDKEIARRRKLGLLDEGEDLSISMLRSDPPDHTRLRKLVSKAFTPRAVSALEPKIESIVKESLDHAAARGGMDVIADLAYPVPVIVIAEMIGVPAADQDRFKHWSDEVVRAMGVSSIADVRRSNRATKELSQYFHGIAEDRRKNPRDDLMSGLLAAEAEGDRLSEQEVFTTLQLLLIAGNETTTNLIGNGLLALMRNPEQFEYLHRHPERVEAALEELLRYDGPVQATSRMALENLEIDGHEVSKGQNAFVLLGSANRDPAHFADPDRLDVTRDVDDHLGFGHGRHFCLGANLARLEAKHAIRSVVERFPNMKLAIDEPRWRANPILHGMESLPVRI